MYKTIQIISTKGYVYNRSGKEIMAYKRNYDKD